jgi:hypothetical protein
MGWILACLVVAESNAVVINGDPTSPIVLEQAGVLIANLPTDVENPTLCVPAKKYGVAYVIANARDPDYLEAFNIAGADKMLAAVDALYEELINVTESPSIKESVELGEYKLFVVDSDANERVAGKKPGELEEKNKGLHFPASLKGGEYSGNRQAKIPGHYLAIFLAEKKEGGTDPPLVQELTEGKNYLKASNHNRIMPEKSRRERTTQGFEKPEELDFLKNPKATLYEQALDLRQL